MKNEPTICKRIITALESYNDATPERLKALWELGDMTRPTTRQIARAAHLLVLAGKIEVVKIKEEGRTVTYYAIIKEKWIMDADTIRNNTAFVVKLWILALLLFIGSLFLFS